MIDFRTAEAIASGLFSRRVGNNLHIFLEQVADFLDNLQLSPSFSLQAGTVTLAGSVSPFIPPFIPATVTANSGIFTNPQELNGSAILGAFVWADTADRVVGDVNSGGGFVLRSTDLKGNPEANDQGIYNWQVVNP